MAFNTVMIVILTGFVGALLARYQGLQTILRVRESLNRGQMPASKMLDALLIVIEGITLLTPGVLTWLKKYDTSNDGYLDQDDLKKNWLTSWKKGREDLKLKNDKKEEEFNYARKTMISDLSTEKLVAAVPITVGFNKRTGKKIIAVPKKPKKGLIV